MFVFYGSNAAKYWPLIKLTWYNIQYKHFKACSGQTLDEVSISFLLEHNKCNKVAVEAQQILDKPNSAASSVNLLAICCCISQKWSNLLKTSWDQHHWGIGGGWVLVSLGHCGSLLWLFGEGVLAFYELGAVLWPAACKATHSTWLVFTRTVHYVSLGVCLQVSLDAKLTKDYQQIQRAIRNSFNRILMLSNKQSFH